MSEIQINEQEIKDVDLFIFDKDGTIIDIHFYWGALINLRAKYICDKFNPEDNNMVHNKLVDAMGFDVKTKKLKPEGPVGIKPRSFIIDKAFETFSQFQKVDREEISEIFKTVDVFVNKDLKDYLKILPGVRTFLSDMKLVGAEMAVATSDLTDRAHSTMEILQIDSFFNYYIGGDKAESKPAPDMVNKCVSHFNVSKKNTYVVGDSMADLELAKNGECHFIGVKTGLHNDKFLSEAEYLVEFLTDIKLKLEK
jgi:phosphoglycolate phosphatase